MLRHRLVRSNSDFITLREESTQLNVHVKESSTQALETDIVPEIAFKLENYEIFLHYTLSFFIGFIITYFCL
ncbi:unnamed protein product [Nezara viridula]|uniref:Uncharacterized protein n=1 Tax=Nezara viridula TaxID=85310 RepID=A0A9P0MRG6_NEZVI|nr:unnamed protein product [Nezara viridula]